MTPPLAAPGGATWRDAWRRLRKNRMAVACGVLFAVIVGFCFLGPLLARAIAGLDGVTQDYVLLATPPSLAHPFGTDALGRDMLVRVMMGGQVAIMVAIVATLVALTIGLSWGAIAAYAGGRVDFVLMRIVDTLYGFPTVVFVIVIMATVQTRSTLALFALIGGISWLTMARIVRGQVLSLRHRDFVDAARAIGARPRRILFRHIVPNTMGVVIVYATLTLPHVMLTEAFLSFLGLGVQAPLASWGTLVTEGSTQILVYPWLLIAPGVVMGLTIFALNFLGDGLRDALDPHTRRD
jgi:oligopeptide transport system permease protein